MELDMPEVRRCFGVFPPKYATYLISLFGIASGLLGLAGIVLYGVAEEMVTAIFTERALDQLNEDIKKVVLLTIGLSSILLVVANVFLLIGSLSKSRGAVGTGVTVLLLMCLLLLAEAISGPVACFFISDTCLVKRVSLIVLCLGIGVLTIFIEIWFYFTAVAWNYEQEL